MCVCVPLLLYPFIHWWILRLSPYLGYCNVPKSCSQKDTRGGGDSPSALREPLCLSHNAKVTFLHSPHNLHPIPKNFHVHRESTIGMSHKVEIREFSLGRKKNQGFTHITHKRPLSLQYGQLTPQVHLPQLTCSTLMSISPWIFFPLKYFALERKSRVHLSMLKSQEDKTQAGPLTPLLLQCHYRNYKMIYDGWNILEKT